MKHSKSMPVHRPQGSAIATTASFLFLRHECNWNLITEQESDDSGRDDYTFKELVSRTESRRRIADFRYSTTACASISTSISDEINRLTSTITVAGRISPKNSP